MSNGAYGSRFWILGLGLLDLCRKVEGSRLQEACLGVSVLGVLGSFMGEVSECREVHGALGVLASWGHGCDRGVT